jgi:hypothetical protein
VNTSQREQYGGTVHLFIGKGHSPNKITFMPLITNHDYNTNYQGLCSIFLFKSVPTSSQAHHHAEALLVVASAYVFMLQVLACYLAKGVFA